MEQRKKAANNERATKVILVATVLSGLLAAGLGGVLYAGDRTPSVLLRPDDPEIVANGKRVYTDQCAACHGDKLQGEPDWRGTNEDGRLRAPPHDETGHTWHHADELLFGITKFGLAEIANRPSYETDMPVFKDILSDEDIIAALSFIKSTWPDRIRQMHDQRNAQK